MTSRCSTKRKKTAIFFVAFFLFAFFMANLCAAAVKITYVSVKSGDNLSRIFKKQGVSQKTLQAVARLPAAKKPLKNLHIGQRMRFTVDAKRGLESLAVALNKKETLVVFRAGARYVARVERAALRENVATKTVTPPAKKTAITLKKPIIAPKKATPTLAFLKGEKIEVKSTAQPKKVMIVAQPQLHYAGMIIHQSLYADGKKQKIPNKVLQQLTKIFAVQINFQDIRPNDSVVLAYNNAEEIVAAKFTRGKRSYAAIRYVNAQGVVEYFTPTGEGSKRAFDRFPVKYTHINSLFNLRRVHPVSHVVRPHNGIDLAAPLGTPIHAIGNGKISFIGWDGAYGNLIKIQHDERYASMYAHLLRFAPGLSKGSYVSRGQLIGYLGQTGNATGPHVHYEIHVNNKPVNPLTAPLPYASSIPAGQKAAFLAKAKQLMAALDEYRKKIQ